MLNDVVTIQKKHEKAAETLFERVMLNRSDKYIVAIAGEVGAGKCEIAHVLGRKLVNEGIRVKILHMDNYYIIPPAERMEWRKKHGINKIGFEEYDWMKVNSILDDFMNSRKSVIPIVDLFTNQVDELHTDFNKIDTLIIEGLYAIRVTQADLRVFIELTYRETWEEQLMAQKEVLDEFRLEILKREHQVVQSLKKSADFFIDFDNSDESFHL